MPGVGKFFTLPPVPAEALPGPRIAGMGFSAGELVMPELQVLPMGWSWALHLCQCYLVSAIHGVGVSEGSVITDGRDGVLLGSPSDVGVAAYVDNYCVVGQDASGVDRLCDQISAALTRRGLVVHDLERSSGQAVFTGFDIDGERQRLRVRADRLWSLRAALDALLEKGFASSAALGVVTGHLAWAMMARREALSLLAGCYAFAHDSSIGVRPLWPAVRKELAWARSLLPLFAADLGAAWHDIVLATDASSIGAGVCTAPSLPEEAAAVGRCSERWRYTVTEACAARRHALGGEPPASGGLLPAARADADSDVTMEELTAFTRVQKPEFAEVPHAFITTNTWKNVHASRHPVVRDILGLEADALEIGIRHVLRSGSAFSRRLLALVDNLPLALAATKGRGAAETLRAPLRKITALLLCSGCRLYTRWIPSEWNPSDGASRGAVGWFANRMRRCSPEDHCRTGPMCPAAGGRCQLAR